VAALQPQRHEPPPGWPRETFERLTAALAAALVAAYRRAAEEEPAASGVEARPRGGR
jgi:hypothetical protein